MAGAVAILVLALIPAIAQAPGAADGSARIEVRAQPIEAFNPREVFKRALASSNFAVV
jgi:hypothetical protein